MEVRRFEVYQVNLNPAVGHEIRKTRPCVIISPNEMNAHISTVIVAPMTTRSRKYPTRVACRFKRKSGEIVLDQIRTIDKARLLKKLGVIDHVTQRNTLAVLQEMFAV